jgi:hypothetical protein
MARRQRGADRAVFKYGKGAAELVTTLEPKNARAAGGALLGLELAWCDRTLRDREGL